MYIDQTTPLVASNAPLLKLIVTFNNISALS